MSEERRTPKRAPPRSAISVRARAREINAIERSTSGNFRRTGSGHYPKRSESLNNRKCDEEDVTRTLRRIGSLDSKYCKPVSFCPESTTRTRSCTRSNNNNYNDATSDEDRLAQSGDSSRDVIATSCLSEPEIEPEPERNKKISVVQRVAALEKSSSTRRAVATIVPEAVRHHQLSVTVGLPVQESSDYESCFSASDHSQDSSPTDTESHVTGDASLGFESGTKCEVRDEAFLDRRNLGTNIERGEEENVTSEEGEQRHDGGQLDDIICALEKIRDDFDLTFHDLCEDDRSVTSPPEVAGGREGTTMYRNPEPPNRVTGPSYSALVQVKSLTPSNSRAAAGARFSNHSTQSVYCHTTSRSNSVRAKPELPSYLTLGRKGFNSNYATQRDKQHCYASCDNLGSSSVVRYRGHNEEQEVSLAELQKIRNILANLDFSKFKRGNNKSSPGGVTPDNNRQLVRKISFGRNNGNNCSPTTNWNQPNSRLKELTEKLKPQTAPSSPNPAQGSNPRRFTSALRSSSYSNFRSVPFEHMNSNLFPSRASFQESMQNNPLVRATATLPRRKMGVSGAPPASDNYSLLPVKDSNEYLDLETSGSNRTSRVPKNDDPYDEVYYEAASERLPVYQRSISVMESPRPTTLLKKMAPKFSTPTFSSRTCGGVPVPERRKRRKATEVTTPEPEMTNKSLVTTRSLTHPLLQGDEEDRFRSLTRGSKAIASLKRDQLHQKNVEDSNEERAKSFKKKHHSDPGTDKTRLVDILSAGAESSDSEETSGEVVERDLASRSVSCVTSRHVRYGSDGGGSLTPTSGTLPRLYGSCETVDPLFSKNNSPQQQRRYSKKRLRGPYGEMLEEEMRKSGEQKHKQTPGEMGFLKDIPEYDKEKAGGLTEEGNQSQQRTRPQAITASQSLDNTDLKRSNSDCNAVRSGTLSNPSVSPDPPEPRKISASNLSFLRDCPVTSTSSEPNLVRSLGRKQSKRFNYEALASVGASRGQRPSADEARPLTRWSGEGVKAQALLEVTPVEKNDVGIKFSDTRTHVVGELYDTERSYVESLQILANKYMKPLKSSECSGMVDSSLVDEIFFQIPEILNHHESFLELLRQRLTSWDSKQKIGDVFVEAFTKQPIVDTYTAFINNWKSAKEAIKLAVQAKPSFAKFLEHMSREHKGKLTLDALLIMPVQRIPRYELLIKELLKHTQLDHPDHHLLIIAQREVHDLAVKINRVEREAFQHEQMQQRVKDIEHLIDGVMELVQPDRTFIRYDMVAIPGGLGTKKERCFFLFSDLLLITSMKRKSGTIRKSSSTSASPSPFSNMEMNKYKLLMRFSLDNLDIAGKSESSGGGNSGMKKAIKEMECLEEDLTTLNQMMENAATLHCPHQSLDEVLKEMVNSVNKQLLDKQTTDAQLLSLDLTVTTQEGVDNLSVIFQSAEKRGGWEETFNEAKHKLALSTDRRPPPEFMYPLPIRKTRAGLQFTCSACTLGLNSFGLKDVWVCNSDGYVGQVCVLSLQPEPTVTSCNGVCNARILCAMSIPAATPFYLSSRRKSLLPDSSVSISFRVEDTDLDETQRPSNGNFQLDSESSEEEEEIVESPDEEGKSQTDGSKEDELDNMQPTMWLGTEDGCIYVYNCSDNIRIKKNKTKIQHSAAVHCIIYLDNRVFVSLANGELVIYRKELEGGWYTVDVQRVTVGNTSAPVTRMLPVAGKLWCACQNTIKVLNTLTLDIEISFQVSSDSSRPVICMVTSGLGVWTAIQHSSVVRLFHATSYESLLDVNVSPAVTKMLSGCDDIIRQHKAACLRVSALLACKDLLWVGTSAGVILTLPMPHLTSTTTKLDNVPNVAAVPHGHTGHVRFLTCVEMSPTAPLGLSKLSHRSIRSKEGLSARRASTAVSGITSTGYRLLVISGGDGYEDFRSTPQATEAAGRDDSTNHLLLWQV